MWKVPNKGDLISVHHLDGTFYRVVRLFDVKDITNGFYKRDFENMGVVPVIDENGESLHIRYKNGLWELPYEMTPEKQMICDLYNELSKRKAVKRRLDTWLMDNGYPVTHPMYLDEHEVKDIINVMSIWINRVREEQSNLDIDITPPPQLSM